MRFPPKLRLPYKIRLLNYLRLPRGFMLFNKMRLPNMMRLPLKIRLPHNMRLPHKSTHKIRCLTRQGSFATWGSFVLHANWETIRNTISVSVLDIQIRILKFSSSNILGYSNHWCTIFEWWIIQIFINKAFSTLWSIMLSSFGADYSPKTLKELN